MPGAGKSEVSRLLVDEHGFASVYFGQVVLDELAARGLARDAGAERTVREALRAAEGMAVMAARSLPRIRAALATGAQVCVDGLYSGAEWELLARETGVVLLAVHAPRWLRKQRLAARPTRPFSVAELDARDLSEVRALDKATPIALADLHVVNDGDLARLRARVGAALDDLDRAAAAKLAPDARS